MTTTNDAPAQAPSGSGQPGEGMEEMAAIAQIVSEWRHGPLLSPEALRRIRASLASDASPRGEPTQAEREAANSAFREWWDREQACPEHSMTTQNAAHAAWQEAYRVYRASPRGEAVAYHYEHPKFGSRALIAANLVWPHDDIAGLEPHNGWKITPLYAHPAPATVEMRRVRHKKRGTTYRVLHGAVMQTAHWHDHHYGKAADGRTVVVYQSEDDGSVWVRPASEFEDGRFEEVAALASPAPASEPEGSHG